MEQGRVLNNLIAVRLRNKRLVWYPPGAVASGVGAPGAGAEAEAVPLDNEEARAALRATLAQRRSNICFLAPGADVRLLQLQLSAEEKKHIAKSLAFLLEDQVAADIEDLHFASRPLAKLELSVAICSHEKMREWQQQLADFPALSRWVPEPLVLPWQAGEWTLVVEAGQAVVRYGECEGFTIERSVLPAMLMELARDGEEPETIVVYGQAQEEDTGLLPAALRERVQWRRGSLGSALLLADDSAGAVNLLQGEYAPRLPLERWWRQWRVAAAVFAAAFMLQLVATWVDYHRLQKQNLELRTAMEESYRRANPRGAAPEPEKQLRRQLDAIRGTAPTSGFISLMERVGAVIAARPGTAIASVNYNDRGGEMRMNIIAADFESVEAIRAGINQAGLEAEMESSNAQGDKVRARIRVGEKS